MAYPQQARYGPSANYHDAPRSAPLEPPQEYAQDEYNYGLQAQPQGYGYDDGYYEGPRDARNWQQSAHQRPGPSPQQYQASSHDQGRSQMRSQNNGYGQGYGDSTAVNMNGNRHQQHRDPYYQHHGSENHHGGQQQTQSGNRGYQGTAYGQKGWETGYQNLHQDPSYRNNQDLSRPRPPGPQRSFSAGPGVDADQPAIQMGALPPPRPPMSQQQARSQTPQGRSTAQAPRKKEKERINLQPQSPDSLAWDNPFPTFPGIQEKKQAVKADASRPATAASGRRSHESTRSLDRDPGHINNQHQQQLTNSNQRPPPQRQYPQNPMQSIPENRPRQGSTPSRNQPQEASGYGPPQYDGFPNSLDVQMTMSPPQPGFTREQRSNTLPNEVSESMMQVSLPLRPQVNRQAPYHETQRQIVHPPPNAYPPQQNMSQQRHRRSNSYDSSSIYSQAMTQSPPKPQALTEPQSKPTAYSRRPSGASSQRSKTPMQDQHGGARYGAQQDLPRSNTPGNSQGYNQTSAQSQPAVHQAPNIPQAASAVVVDSYAEDVELDAYRPYRSNTNTSLAIAEDDEDMPNFDAALTSPTHDKTLHIEPHSSSSPQNNVEPRGRPTERGREESFAGQAKRSRSQPNLRQQNSPNDYAGFDFGINKGQLAIPQVNPEYNASTNQGYHRSPQTYQGEWQRPNGGTFGPPGRSQPGGFGPGTGGSGPGPMQRSSPGPQQYMGGNGPVPAPPGTRNSPGPGAMGRPPLRNAQAALNTSRAISDGSQRLRGDQARSPNAPSGSSPTNARPTNPDALPHHPAPSRPGHNQQMQSPPISQQNPSRPPPVRQYNSPSPQAQPSIAPPPSQPSSAPVTLEELQRLRGVVQTRPNDQATQLLLAKKLVEAASVLADEGGRADPKTRSKNRERYTMESYKMVKKLVGVGNTEAMFFLADCHGSGQLGLQKDPKEAFQLYQSAAKLNHPQSAYRVAVCCEIGLDEGGGTRKDPVKAIQWYQRAATLGDVPAMYKLGVVKLKGLLGQRRDPREALNWLQKAAERADEENPHALHELGLLYTTASASDGIPRDENSARQLFSRAADLGYKFSQFKLGQAYEQGQLGLQQNPKASIMWYSKAAMQEEHQSELGLSGWYLTGAEGVLGQNDTEAYLWARKAAQAGLAKAEYAMGYFTEVGIGAPSDMEGAKRWYWRAASQNFPKAKERLEELRRGGSKIQKTRVSRSAINKPEGDCRVM